MKTRITITLDADLLASARTRAQERGMSVSGDAEAYSAQMERYLGQDP